MRELVTSAALVLAVTILGFLALDSLDSLDSLDDLDDLAGRVAPARVDAAPASAPAGASGDQQVPLTVRPPYIPDLRFSVTYAAARWHRLEHFSLATLAHQRLAGCQLELESSGEPVRVSGEWTQTQHMLGNQRFGMGMLTPAGSPFPRQISYSTLEGSAYLVFTLRIGSTLVSETDFQDCRADAEAVMATLR